MTDPETTRVVRSWLGEGVDRMPDRVLDSVHDQLPTTRQRRSPWLARRLRSMSSIVRVAAVAAVVIVAALAGVSLLPGGGVGGPAPTPKPTPTASPPPTPSPLAVTSADVGTSLPGGRYRFGAPFGVPFTISSPTSWKPNAFVGGDVNMAFASSSLAVDLVDNVFADPCHSESGPLSPPVAATVDAITQAVTHMAGFDAGPVSDVVVGGHAAKSFRLSNAIDTATAKCARGAMLPLWTFQGDPTGAATNGGTQFQVWVTEVNGTPVVIAGDGDQTEFNAIVGSMVFE